MADRTGQRVDDYQLVRLLGQGTFGEVYLAQHLYKHTTVAVKILTMEVSDEVLENFLREARTLFLLKHPHIVPLLDFGSEKKVPFLVLEYAPNGTLRQRHRAGERVPLEVVNSYVQQVASALQYAHDQRLIHCDVKPQNMLIGQDGQVLLSDFGVAAIAHSDHSMTAQQMAGTMAYVAPEQIQGKPRPASDQYALGICVYEWLCGVRPFTGSSWELMSQHASAPPTKLRHYVPELPEAVEEVVLCALEKDQQRRFASVTAFATALWQASQPMPPHFAGVDISWPRRGNAERAPSWPEPAPTPSSPEQRTPSWSGPGSTPSAPEQRTPSWSGPGSAPSAPGQGSVPSVPQSGPAVPASEPPMSVFNAPTIVTPGPGEMYITPQQAVAFNASQGQPSQPAAPSAMTPPFFPDAYPGTNPTLLTPSGSVSATEPSLPPSLRPAGGPYNQSAPPPGAVAVPRRRFTNGRLLALVAVAVLVLLVGILTPVLLLRNQQSTSTTGVTATATAQAQATSTAQTAAIAAAYQDWVNTHGMMFGFDPAHTHWNRLEQIIGPKNITQLRVLWTYEAGNLITAAPTVANGIVYVGAHDGNLDAFDATCRHACRPLWSYALGHDITSSPAVVNGVVYVGSDDHKLYAFNATCRSACQPLWSYTAEFQIYSSPAVANGVIYVGSDDHRIYAFDTNCRSACQPLWSYKTGGAMDDSPAVANGMVYIGAFNNKLFVFDATCRSACQPLWSYQVGGGIAASPAIANGLVYVGSDDGKLYVFDATCRSACQPLWSYKAGNRIRSSAAIANGLVYVGSDDGNLYAFDATCRSACQPLWSYKAGGSIDSSPTVANGVVYVGSHDRKLYAFNANCRASCKPIWSYKTGGTFFSPTVANGVIYVGSGDHKLYAFGL